MDWDITAATYANNSAAYDSLQRMGYAYFTTANNQYVGIKLLSAGTPNYYAYNNDGTAGSFSIYDGYTKAEKYQSMSDVEKAKYDPFKASLDLETKAYAVIRQGLINEGFLKADDKVKDEDLEDLWIIHHIDNTAADALNNAKRPTHDYKTKFKTLDPFSLEGPTAAQLGEDPKTCRQECKADTKAKEAKEKKGGND